MAFQNDGSYQNAVAITPNDTTQIKARGFVVTVAGVVTIVDTGGVTTAIPCAVGIIMNIEASIIKSTGTTATGIVALF